MSGRFMSVDRDTAYLLPPSVQEWLPENHLARFVVEIVEQLMRLAQEADQAEITDGMSVPAELQRREERLAAIAQAKAAIEARAAERYAREQAAYAAKMAERKAKEERTGRKAGGAPPAEPQPGPRPKDQVNLTDADSRIMPTAGGGFEQAYNAQAAVDVNTMLIVAQHVSQNPNDKQEVEPALEQLEAVAAVIGKAEALVADNGYFSTDNVDACHEHHVEPYLAAGRDAHYPPLAERLSEPVPLAEEASAVDRMKHRLRTPEGREVYASRKCTVEPTFGIIKSVLGFRQFLLRGLQAVQHEWALVCIGWNLKRLHRLQIAA